MNKLNVLYATNDNYLPHAAASIYSLLENNKDFEKINICIIDDISNDCKTKLNDMVTSFSNASLVFYPFDKLKDKLKIKESWFAMVGYARLMVSDCINADKVLYVDCDTIINASLKDLWKTDIEDYLVAGVQDNPHLYALKAIGMSKYDRYINSGVILINLKKWKQENIEQKIIKMIEDKNGNVFHHDQGIINGVCKNSIKILPPKFNCMSQFFYLTARKIKALYNIKNYYMQNELDEAVKNPVIVHYISKFYNRPWFKSCTHPLKNLYIDYLEKTPFEVALKDGDLKKSVKLRKFIFSRLPFFIYFSLEKLLNIRRKLIAKK